ncbi:MAG: RNA polymerase factor sigma-54 [Chitinophagaceae bacterium]
MALGQGLHQKLLQKLSPQQIQLMKLLQVPTALLEERIKEEIEENPALELSEESAEPDNLSDTEEEFTAEGEEEEGIDEYENFDLSEYVSEDDDEIADYKLRGEADTDVQEPGFSAQGDEATFHDFLLAQLGMMNLDERQQKIAEQIIGSIDDDGYLRRETLAIADDLAFRQNLEVPADEIEELIQRIQQFDPPGVAARNLQECLLLQLKRKETEGKIVGQAIEAIQDYFDEFTKKHYEKIQRGLGLSESQLREVIGQIIKLTPKPGANYGGAQRTEDYVVPDFFVFNQSGKLELTLNARNAPDLRISEGYREMLRQYDHGSKKDKRQKEAVLFIKQKIDAAKWFIDAIKQRQHTLSSVMQTIIEYQREFFLSGDETTLRPMILKDIAERTHLDISTVSRVANSKFVQTEYGTYRLKFFFSESLSTDTGEEVSTREVKKILSDLIEGENKLKPLSDERLTELLQEKGYNIARRTVAKYREQLTIPVARLRKQL